MFGKNLEQLLLQPPIAGKVVLGWDPAFRTGCKLAVVDPTGKVLATKVIYPTEPHNKVAESKAEVKKLIDKYHVNLISCGNGTASRESEKIISDMIHEMNLPVDYVITNEAGASVYSASKLATEEFPDFDVAQRSAVSIARRVQDPLAELVKIDPKSIGVGQYQHDMNQKKLDEAFRLRVDDREFWQQKYPGYALNECVQEVTGMGSLHLIVKMRALPGGTAKQKRREMCG